MDKTAVIIVDHGSRRAQSNEMLDEVVAMFQRVNDYEIVEAAHMELAEPSIKTAFDKCVAQGANKIVVNPYFLSPGRHWKQDIPELVDQAAAFHPEVTYMVTAPLGLHEMMAKIMNERIEYCLKHAAGEKPACPVCDGVRDCIMKRGG